LGGGDMVNEIHYLNIKMMLMNYFKIGVKQQGI